MSYKTDRLIDLFPHVYAAHDSTSLLYKLLDAIAAELMQADETVKRLLKSHWVAYAEGPALDGLGAIFAVTRRTLRDGMPETDAAFRQRLQSVVPLFTGGGTRQAVLGAVRSALGLPFDLDQLGLPPEQDALRREIEDLVTLEEFAPTRAIIRGTTVTLRDDASELQLDLTPETVREGQPEIHWLFTRGSGRNLELRVAEQGIRAAPELLVPPNQPLILTNDENGHLRAQIGRQEVTRFFTNLDGSRPARLPPVPRERSTWIFHARSGIFDAPHTEASGGFDHDTFDLPQFQVELLWVRYQPLTFAVRVPYFLRQTVEQLRARRGYTGNLLVFEGLPPEAIPAVVDQTRAAGVQATVSFSLYFVETHNQTDALRLSGTSHHTETLELDAILRVGSLKSLQEQHDTRDRLRIGGVLDLATFDGDYGFV